MESMKEFLDIPQPEYSVALIHDVEYKRVAAFPKGAGNNTLRRGLTMQILVPRLEDRTRPQGPYPMVVYAPGGGWKIPLVRYRLPMITDLARRGFVVAMVEYRGSEYFNCWREAVEDVRSAIRYITRHAAEYSADAEKIILFGDSAGAHLSMMAAYSGCEFDGCEDDRNIPVRVRGVMELFGPTDLVRMNRELYSENLPDHPVIPLMRETMMAFAKCNSLEAMDALLEPAGVLARIKPETEIPPTLIAHGDQDIMVPLWCAEELYQSLLQAGKTGELYVVKNARHGDMRFYGKDMMDRYERFIRKYTE